MSVDSYSRRVAAAYRGAEIAPLAASLAAEIARWRVALAAAHSRAKAAPARAFVGLARSAKQGGEAVALTISPDLELEAANAAPLIEQADRAAEQAQANVAHEAAPLALAIAARLVAHAAQLARGQGAELAPVLLDIADRLAPIPVSPPGDAAPVVVAIADLCERITYTRETRTQR